MNRRAPTPKIDSRTASDLLLQLRAMAPHYTREWPARDDDDPGVALLKIFSFIAEGVINRLNRAPDRNFLAFLDMLGVRLLPATPARAPVRFLPAPGTASGFIVPKGTQVSAPPVGERPEELPFETTREMFATPAALAALVAADPARDRIYKPPPGFLALTLAATDPPALTLRAFSAAGSKSLQLGPPGLVQEGDFLRIERPRDQAGRGFGCDDFSVRDAGRGLEHPVVSEVKGAIVTLTEPLADDYAEGTIVRKLTKFELFEGKNFQEHILYLAHGEYFDLKSGAQVELEVEHAPVSPQNLQPLTIAWEFFGEVSKVEGWHGFEVAKDESDGLSHDGVVRLNIPATPAQSEVKETAVNGNESRWIRARLVEPVPASMAARLPVIESIKLKVSREEGKDIAPDQAFHNDTPLTVNIPFNPFGLEPRTLDRFYLASAEAFSKPGADVTLDIDLGFSEILSEPAVIFHDGKLSVFAQGAAGRLWEFKIDHTRAQQIEPVDHQTPVGVRIRTGSVPAVVEDAKRGRLGVFTVADDGRVYLRLVPKNSPSVWKPLDPPGKVELNPAAVLNKDNKWEVFVVIDGKVLSKVVDPADQAAAGSWTPVGAGKGDDFIANSTPFAIPPSKFPAGSNPLGHTWLLVTDTDAADDPIESGRTHLFDGANWIEVTPDESGDPKKNQAAYLARPNARPFGHFEGNSLTLRVYLRNKSDELVSFDASSPNVPNAQEKNLGTPPGFKVASNPSAIRTPAGTRIYVRGDNQELWEVDPAPTTPVWATKLRPTDFELSGDPVALDYPPTASPADRLVSVLSNSNKNALLELRIPSDEVHKGILRAGPRDFILLANPLADGTFYVRISSNPGSDPDVGVVRRLIKLQNESHLALLDSPLNKVTTAATKYELFEQVEGGLVVEADETHVTLKDGTQAVAGDFVFANGQLREIEAFGEEEEEEEEEVGATRATLTSPWTEPPEAGDSYVVLRLVHAETNAQAGCELLARLAVNADDTESFYKDLSLELPEHDEARQLVEYNAAAKIVRVQTAFTSVPLDGDDYEIRIVKWFIHRMPDLPDLRPALSWEYWNGAGWMALKLDNDATANFLFKGEVTFKLPEDIAKTEVAGQENYWIRARIVGGDYGREVFVQREAGGALSVSKDAIRPPFIRELKITYKVTEYQAPQFCLTFNNLDYLDQTSANTTPDKNFRPYVALPVEQRAIFFGFDREIKDGPVRLYFAAKELVVNERARPKLAWEFATDNEWRPILAEDETDALTKPEIVTWGLPDGFQQRQHFGEALFWIRATQAEGNWDESPLLAGVFPNTVEALQARTVRNEILGSSVGTKDERFRFQQLPVLEGEEVRVREVLTDEERKQLILAEGEDAVFEVRDQEGRALETWVRWREVQEFFDSVAASRHYRLDRASGELLFGDGVRGRILPAGGDNVRAFSYQAGGGSAGNVDAGQINAPVTAVAGVESVINPVAAGGGSEKATEEEMLEIGPAQVSNRGRAVTPEDFERLAKEASREVRKARCVPNRNAAGRNEVGWTSIYVVPGSKDVRPAPSLELRRVVQRFLAERADVTLADQEHIFVGPPQYVSVDVQTTVYAKSLDVIGTAEQKVRKQLHEFLHPLTGGPAGEGWDFGRDLAASDLYLLLEEIEEVDHVRALRLVAGETESEEQIEVGPDALLASGTHTVTMKVEGGE